MPELTTHDLWDLTKTIFDFSPQAVLIAEKATITYCNAAALEMLQFNPTDSPLIDFVDYRFASAFLSPEHDPTPLRRTRVRFGEGYYEVLAIPHGSLLFLFFYYSDVAHTTKDLLRDMAHSLLALTASAHTDLEQADTSHLKDHLNEIDLAIQEALSACDPVLFPYDFSSLLQHALMSFTCVTEHGMLSLHKMTDVEKLFVPMHCKLLHAGLVGTVFDLLRLTSLRDPLAITLEHSNTDVTIAFSCKHTQFPAELYTLLFAQDASNPVRIMQQYGTHLFRARRIFSLHNGAFQIQNGQKGGFTLSVTLPRTAHPPVLYTGDRWLADFPAVLSLPADYIRRFFGLDSEKP